ncbi:MAG: HD domain-containing protein [Lachnospiraceae bacterium]|nr:HD domain-containing protein [Lachnospiraceae bacterium]
MKEKFKKISVFISLFIICFSIILYGNLNVLATEDETPLVKTIFNERNGLPTGEANDILQTSDGYIWIGSYGGLIRYDGTEFRNYSAEGILQSSSVRSIFEDSMQRLWIGTNDAGIFIMEDGVITKPEGQPEDFFLCVRGFAEAPDGTIYAASTTGICEIKDGVMNIYTCDEVAGKSFYSLGVDCYERLWAVNNDGGCVVMQAGEVINVIKATDFFQNKEESIYSVAGCTDGSIYIGGSHNSIVRLQFIGTGFSTSDIETTKYKPDILYIVNNLREVAPGIIAASGSQNVAFLDTNGNVIREVEAVDVNNSFVDYMGNIWLASGSQGVVRYAEGCFGAYAPDIFSDLSLNAVAVSDGRVYAGLNYGIIVADGNSSSSNRALSKVFDQFEGIRIRDIIADKNGDIWIASYSDMPVVCFHPDTYEMDIYSIEDGLANNKARVLCELNDGSIAVGTQNGISIIANGKVRESYTDLEQPSILCILELEDGTLLLGSDGNGIYEIKDGNIKNYSFSDGLSEGVVLRILQDKENSFFVSAGSSLYYMEDGSFEKLTTLKKEAGSIFDMYITNGRLWLLQNSGILEVDKENLLSGGDGTPVTYGFNYGMTGSLNANTRHCFSDGELYLATRNGISIFTFKVPENVLPMGIINNVVVDNVTYDHPTDLKVKGDTNRITINYAAFAYDNMSDFKVAYKLEGFDDEEHMVTDSGNSISYTNLPGGEYEFKLRFFIPGSNESKVYSFHITKEKRLIEHTWFVVGMIIIGMALIIGIITLIYKVKLNVARKRQQKYHDILVQSLLTFAGTIDAKDAYTNDHSTHVAEYSRELAKRMGLSNEEQEHIYYVALLHDIGKIGIPDYILNKPDKLTDEEYEVIKTHPQIGADILKNFTSLKGIADGAHYHHERYDGTGYCEGLKGEDIPLVARIIAVADAYDAMSSERCYRKPRANDYIENELRNAAGTQLDPNIVPYMLEIIAEKVENEKK